MGNMHDDNSRSQTPVNFNERDFNIYISLTKICKSISGMEKFFNRDFRM
jgi:hypothetical protein